MTFKQPKKALVVSAAGAFLLLILAFFLPETAQIYTVQGATMGTTWSVQINSTTSPSPVLQKTSHELETLLHHLDVDVYSTWNAGSELSRLNAGPTGAALKVSAELMAVLAMSKELHAATDHAFDITIGPLVNLWGFGPEEMPATLPDAAVVEQHRQKLGMADLVLDTNALTVLKNKALTLDLSAIAKGYVVDEAARLLIRNGYTSFLVEIGGEIRAQGLRPDDKPWVIAVEIPSVDMRAPYAALSNYGEAIAVAGSGDYRNFHEIDGVVYSHEIDPRTGYPIAHNLAAVTVIADSTAKADAWATALMVLGPAEGKALADSENVAAYFIMRDGAVLQHTYTAGFARFLYYPEQGI